MDRHIQLPDVEGPALIGLELLIFLGGILFLQHVAGGGVPGDDAGGPLDLDPLTVVEDFGGSGRGNEDEGAAKDKDKGREWFHGGGPPGETWHSRTSPVSMGRSRDRTPGARPESLPGDWAAGARPLRGDPSRIAGVHVKPVPAILQFTRDLTGSTN